MKAAHARHTSRLSNLFALATILVFAVVLIGAIANRSHLHPDSEHARNYQTLAKEPQNLDQLLSLNADDLLGVDIARMNLLCAEGLPGAEKLNVEECLTVLDQWAQHIKTETDRNYHRFREDRAYYSNSEAFYKMLIMAVNRSE